MSYKPEFFGRYIQVYSLHDTICSPTIYYFEGGRKCVTLPARAAGKSTHVRN